MIKKCFVLVMVFCIFAVSPLSAAMVSFLVIETGLPMEAASNQHSGLWESGLLDEFFEAGHIVSNSPILRIDQKPSTPFPEEAEEAFDEAVAGGAEYFILAVLDYTVASDGSVEKPGKVSLKVYKAVPQKLLYERQYADKTSRSTADEFSNVKKTVRGLVSRVKG
ncbi:MAG: hypothetical protein LBN21_11830 [Treponema sp.]|nr:hypothetical protein [Treponema sp.]